MEEKGIEVDGKIRIHLVRGRKKRYVGVKDNAEGMDESRMEEAIGKYGEDMSGLSSGLNVRGVFGRGLKDAVLAVGEGDVFSIIGEKLYRCHLRAPWTFKLDPPKDVSKEDRKRYGISGNGTLVFINVTNKKVSVPRFEKLAYSLERNVQLRDIMKNPKREVILEERDSKGRVKRSKELSYRDPVGEVILERKAVPLEGFPDVTIDIVVLRSEEPLIQEGFDCDGGLLIKSGRAIHESTLFKYDHNEYAAHLFGKLRCDQLNSYMRDNEPVISDKRDGLNWDYEICAAIRRTGEGLLKPIIEKERERIEKKEKIFGTAETKTRIRKTVKELNKIAAVELGLTSDEGTLGRDDSHVPPVPANGFEFIPDYYLVENGKTQTLSLKVLSPSIIPNGSSVRFESETSNIAILGPSQSSVDSGTGVDGIVTLNARIEGRRVGVEGRVVASVNGVSAEAFVRVVSVLKKTESRRKPKKGKKGLFSDIVHSGSQDPRKRVRYFEGKIIISTRSPSVVKYFRGGKGVDDPEYRVLESELVTESVCRTLANLKDSRGEIPYIAESGRIAAIQKEEEDLKYKYARIIHDALSGEERDKK
jgi:hypothetical protein